MEREEAVTEAEEMVEEREAVEKEEVARVEGGSAEVETSL